MEAIKDIPAHARSDAEFSGQVASLASLNPSLISEIVDAINSATTLESLFHSAIELMPVDLASYHHFPSVGAVDYGHIGRFYNHNLPPKIMDYYNELSSHNSDPAPRAVFTKSQSIWLSDLISDPIISKNKASDSVRKIINLTGDGLCIPLYGPNFRRGYMFLGGGLDKTETGPYIQLQLQGLAQYFHIQFCLMIQKLQAPVQLTDRQDQVLSLVAFGKTNQEIADILKISPNTVSGYLKAIFIKLDVSDRVSAAMRAQTLKVNM